MSFIFSAGNAGPNSNTTLSPGNAKNVISVGAAENYRPEAYDGCNFGPSAADNAQEIPSFSSRGPTLDGRVKPDLVAPGTHVTGAATQDPAYDGSGVCEKYYPDGQSLYTWSSGTSHSAPAASGAASLVYRYYQDHFGGQAPSPAMLKAYLVQSTRYLSGAGANDTLPSNSQGFGEIYLARAFDDAARLVEDQNHLLHGSGEVYALSGMVVDTGKPLRIT
ncbi:MAG: S8 family serine peptidase, partial [Anaerolineales bacterium]